MEISANIYRTLIKQVVKVYEKNFKLFFRFHLFFGKTER